MSHTESREKYPNSQGPGPFRRLLVGTALKIMNRSAAHSVVAGERLHYVRQWPRYPISAHAEASDPLNPRKVMGVVSVIGRGGCYFRAVDTFQSGTVLTLRIDWDRAGFETWARVAHAIAGDGMGLAFLDVSPSQLEVLARWINDLAGGAQ